MGAVKSFERHLLPLQGQYVQCLQIGAFVGHASEWLWQNLLSHNDEAFLVDVDTWRGSDEPAHDEFDWEHVELTYMQRVKQAGPAIWKRKMTSDDWFADYGGGYTWDFVYIDGDHHALNALTDGLNAFIDLKVGGILAFDDYEWDLGKGPWYNPRSGINAFILIMSQFIEVLETGSQVWIKKTAELPAR